MSPNDRLRRLIEASGLSARRFAFDVLSRDERTVRRWLAGETIPESAATWLERISVVVTPKRVRIVVVVE